MNSPELKASCADSEDGTYVITWNGERAGTYLMSITLDGVHMLGSPTAVTMHAAEMEVTRCEVAGAIIGLNCRDAVVGVAEKLVVRCRDAMGNDAEATEG